LSRRLVVILLSVFAAATVGVSGWEPAEGATYEQVVDNSPIRGALRRPGVGRRAIRARR
jgi:hypothetical protein